MTEKPLPAWRRCPHCRSMFKPHERNHTFCSPRCKRRYSEQRRKIRKANEAQQTPQEEREHYERLMVARMELGVRRAVVRFQSAYSVSWDDHRSVNTTRREER